MTDYFEERKAPVLYVMVRDDMRSMNAGKAMAHSGHAASMHMSYYDTSVSEDNTSIVNMFNQWQGNTGFGTQINLEGGIDEIHSMVEILVPLSTPKDWIRVGKELLWGMVIDPTYPWYCRLTSENRVRSELTSLWWFAYPDDNRLTPYTKALSLAK